MKNRAPHYRVIYILTKLELGGAQKVCLALMEGLEQQGIATSLISGSEGVLVDVAKKHTSTFLLPSFKRDVSIFSIWQEINNFFIVTKILRKLKKSNPLVIVHTHSTKAGMIGRWAAFFAGINTRVHTVHGYGFHQHQSWLQWLFNYVCEFVTSFITKQFICVSSQDIITGKKLLPLFTKKHTLIRAAVDNKSFAPQASRNHHSPLIIGTISCFKPQKNLFDLLKAFEMLQKNSHKKIQLQIIGDGEQRKNIEDWITAHNLNNSITLLGWQHTLAPLMQQWSIFALSSLWEGLPCAIIEARFCKLPVVAYNVGGISEVIFDAVNGFLVPVGNVQMLTQTILKIINNNHLLTRLSNYQDNLKDFEKDEMVKKHRKLYEHLIAKNTSLLSPQSNTSPSERT